MAQRGNNSNGEGKRTTAQAFIAMPFARRFDSIYTDVIGPALEEIGYDVTRVDEIYKSTAIIGDIEKGI